MLVIMAVLGGSVKIKVFGCSEDGAFAQSHFQETCEDACKAWLSRGLELKGSQVSVLENSADLTVQEDEDFYPKNIHPGLIWHSL